MAPELIKRLAFGPVLAAIAIAALGWDAWHPDQAYGAPLLVSVGVLLAFRELGRLAQAVATPMTAAPSVIGSLALVWWPVIADANPGLVPPGLSLDAIIISLVAIVLCLVHMRRRGYQRFLPEVAVGMMALIYIGLFSSLIVRLSRVPAWDIALPPDAASWYVNRGVPLVLVYIAACKLGDVAAFFGGRTFGRHKMAPAVSPGKTWEGFAASLIGSIGGTLLFAWLTTLAGFRDPFAGWWQAVLWGAVLGPVGVLGDLVESCLKRDADVKDSGTSIPGFGGFLDVFDALLLAAPVAYLLGYLL